MNGQVTPVARPSVEVFAAIDPSIDHANPECP